MEHQVNLKKWLIATRPWSFPASLMPALVVLAYIFYLSHSTGVAEVHIFNGVMALLGVVLFQAAGNLISDYFDYQHGVDQKDTYGSSRLIVDGHFNAKTILNYGLVLLSIATAIGVVLLAKSDILLLPIGLAGVVGTYFYYQLKYRAMGDLLIFVLYGLLIALGTMYVVTDIMDWSILLISTPIGLLIVNILHANNTRDIQPDHRAGIATFAMKVGWNTSRWLYCIYAILAYLLVVLLVVLRWLPYPCLLVFISAPIAIQNMKVMLGAKERDAERIKELDKNSAKLVLVFSMLMVLGNLIAAYL